MTGHPMVATQNIGIAQGVAPGHMKTATAFAITTKTISNEIQKTGRGGFGGVSSAKPSNKSIFTGIIFTLTQIHGNAFLISFPYSEIPRTHRTTTAIRIPDFRKVDRQILAISENDYRVVFFEWNPDGFPPTCQTHNIPPPNGKRALTPTRSP
ncbi:hypothetical protein [Cupriavidus sp. D384]|uniref:hypothetical protein n=1 Tax=Cupriavidus sp. D384 TaxID=1538095 RepID=UPI0012E7AE5E|nr:hypothetical protein [Cupriavidus sp. D384]